MRRCPGASLGCISSLSVLLVAGLAWAQAPAFECNFDQWENGLPVGWGASAAGVRVLQISQGPDVTHGTAAARVEVGGAWWGLTSAPFDLQPAQDYTVMVWGRTERGRIQVQVVGPIGGVLGMDALKASDRQILALDHFKTSDPAGRYTLNLFSMEPNMAFVVDRVQIVQGKVHLTDLSAEDRAIASTWRFHPPEFYQELRAQTRAQVEKAKSEFDADAHPEYRTVVTDSENEIVVQRQLYTVAFSRATCGIHRAVIRGEELTEANMPDLTVVAADGTAYSQSRSVDGNLTVSQDKFNLFFEGTFTPRSADEKQLGASFAVSYNLYKMNGLLTVRYRLVRGSADATRVTVYSTLGRTKTPLNYFFRMYGEGLNGVYHQAKCYELESDQDGIFMPGKHAYLMWTNGEIGFQVFPLRRTWDQVKISGQWPVARGQQNSEPRTQNSELKSPQYLSYELHDKKRYISLTFLNVVDPAALGPEFEAELALSVLPIKRLRPRTSVVGNYIYSTYRDLPPEQNERLLAEQAQNGVTVVFGGGCEDHSQFPAHDYEQGLRRFIETSHRYGLKVVFGQIGSLQWGEDRAELEGVLAPEEIPAFRADESKLNPLRRELMLSMIYNYCHNLGMDGIYFDLAGDEQEVATTYYQEVRLLLDSLPGNKFFVYHNHMEVSPVMSLADFHVPGEQFMHGRWDPIPKAYFEIAYNPLLTGCQTYLYNDESYNLRDSVLWKELVAHSLAPWVSIVPSDPTVSVDWLRAFDDQEMANYERYGQPFVLFDVGSAQWHHPYDEDYGRYANISNPDVTVNLYSRPRETMITVSNGLRDRDRVTIDLDVRALDLARPREGVLVYDTVEQKAVAAKRDGDRLVIPDLEVADAPLILLAKAVKSHEPTLLWHDTNIRGWRVTQPLRVYAGFEAMDVQVETFHGQGISVFHCGDLGPPLNIWFDAAVDRYDPDGKLAFVRTAPGGRPDAYGLVTMGGTMCFGWDEKDATEARAKPEGSTYYGGVQK